MPSMDDSPAQDDGPSGARSPAPSRLRWYQFRLRTLLAVTTAIVGLLVAWRTVVEPCRQQRQTMELIEELGGSFESAAADRWQVWLFGADYQNVVRVSLTDCDQPDKYLPR